MHPLQCRCGALRGQLQGSGISSRVVCYCRDCRAFARFLGREAEVLDERGGTEIVQVAQSRLAFVQGSEHLACMRLSPKGTLRWYAACCRTPVGNTVSDPKMAFIGLIHSVLDRSRIDHDFGTRVAQVNTAGALGAGKPAPRGLAGTVGRFAWMVASARLSGSWRRTPLFGADGCPRVQPQVLSREERERLNRGG